MLRHLRWLFGVWVTCAHAVNTAEFTVTSQPVALDVPRIGVNLGHWTSWGAEQLSSNVLKNPGFEGIIDRTLAVVGKTDDDRFYDNEHWLGRPSKFWSGARFDVRTGAAREVTGLLAGSNWREGQVPDYVVLGEMPNLSEGDVVSLLKTTSGREPAMWWTRAAHPGAVQTYAQDKRPNSPGQQSVLLRGKRSQPARLSYYLDTIGKRAGRLLDFSGEWTLSYWVRVRRGLPQLKVTVGRSGNPLALSQLTQPGLEWQQVTHHFQHQDGSDHGAVELRFETVRSGEVLLDDVVLRRKHDHDGEFSADVVAALQRLRPGFLRDWQAQLGSTFKNQLAQPFARQATRYRPGDRASVKFGYSLPAFLQLSAAVGARPWVVVSTMWSDAEYRQLGRYLATRTREHNFREVIVEFGNENWNPQFRSGGIIDPVRHGLAAERAFSAIREGAGEAPLRMAVNGQFANPTQALKFLHHAPSANLLAVAPYLLNRLDAGARSSATLAAMFGRETARFDFLRDALAKNSAELAVYEVNLHTTAGDANDTTRLPVTAGAAAGSALALRILDALDAGSFRQCAYVLSGFDTPHQFGANSLVRLFGLMRDLQVSKRMRPTGQALALLNRAIGGSYHPARARNDMHEHPIRVAAFKRKIGWSIVAVSSLPNAQTVQIRLPETQADIPSVGWTLSSPDPFAHNEDAQRVLVKRTEVHAQPGQVTFDIPAFGLTVLPIDAVSSRMTHIDSVAAEDANAG